MTTKRIVKSHDGITMTEVTLSSGRGVLSRTYSVRDKIDPTSTKPFNDMGAADTYYEQLILRRQNPEKGKK
jgi:hypothetical protein